MAEFKVRKLQMPWRWYKTGKIGKGLLDKCWSQQFLRELWAWADDDDDDDTKKVMKADRKQWDRKLLFCRWMTILPILQYTLLDISPTWRFAYKVVHQHLKANHHVGESPYRQIVSKKATITVERFSSHLVNCMRCIWWKQFSEK